MSDSDKLRLIFDSSPLITLALFPIHHPALETIVAIADVLVVESVAVETTAYPKYRDAVVIQTHLDANHITSLPIPTTKYDALIDGYKKVDTGEGDTIRLALTMPDAQLVLDDQAAFMAAVHFDLRPIMLPDLLVSLVKSNHLPKGEALKIVSAIALRYSEPFINHVQFKLGEL
jgi:predicted nucleic acid-binding protein